jgi:hypothetical protein
MVTDPKTWPCTVRAQVGARRRPSHKALARSLVYLAAFVGFCLVLGLYRQVGGRK